MSVNRKSELVHTRSLPPVEQIVEGLWSIPVPLWDSPLGYVLVYAFETDRSRLVLVDAGWDAPGSYQALSDGLHHIGGEYPTSRASS